ncbi:MAG: PKD domain-containing protein [Bacteroidales bacterium]|nr:PKD domain-containing protein [Bacteroidales bacterium]MCF8456437.1 PKD domain-containing protein [Bacteroidales bacterium]
MKTILIRLALVQAVFLMIAGIANSQILVKEKSKKNSPSSVNVGSIINMQAQYNNPDINKMPFNTSPYSGNSSHNRNNTKSLSNVTTTINRPAYAFNSYFSDLVIFDLDNPSVDYPISPQLSSGWPIAGTWIYNQWYCNTNTDLLVKINIYDGSIDTVGSTVPGLVGITFDYLNDILLGIQWDGSLYNINWLTGVGNLISQDSDNGFYAIACDLSGNFYGAKWDTLLWDNQLYSVNQVTGSKNLIGNLGFWPNYISGQSMQFDHYTGNLYMAAYNWVALANGSLSGGQLRSVNINTGQSTYIDSFLLDAQYLGFAIPYNPDTLLADFEADTTIGSNPFDVHFNDLSEGYPNAWHWDFGDSLTSNVQNPVHTYQNPGAYTVSLIVSDGVVSDTIVKPNYIIVGLVADFAISDTCVSPGTQVQFADSSTGNILTWYWDYGDGFNDTIQNPLHTYLDTGIYSVSLIVSDSITSDTVSYTKIIHVSDLAANFTFSDTLIEPGGSIQFTDLSSGCVDSLFWDFGDGVTSMDQNPLHFYTNPGIYSVSLIISDGGNSDSLIAQDLIVVSTQVMNIDPIVANVSCFGLNNGAIELNVSDGISPYTYSWSTGVSVSSISNLGPGSYQVTITDSGFIESNLSFNISEPGPLTLSSINYDIACFGFSNGSIDLTVSGGTLPYSYVWSNGSMIEDLSTLSVGIYSVTVSDANNCLQTETTQIATATPILLNENLVDASCNNGQTGSITLSVSGGYAPYSYIWDTGSTSAAISSLGTGNYSVTVNDIAGCGVIESFFVGTGGNIGISGLETNVSCYSGNDGSITTSIVGGTLPYSIVWSNGAVSQNISSLQAGNYSITVSGSNVCVGTAEFTVTAPTDIEIGGTLTDENCFNSQDGAIDLNVSGGISPYSFLWNSGSASEDISNLSGGLYSVTVTDDNACSKTASYNINSNLAITISTSVSNVSCAGAVDGSINISINGGAGNYSFDWSNGAATEDLYNVSIGNYSVIVTDANGCTQTENYTVSFVPEISISEIISPDNGNSDGSIDITISGGTAPYTYSWSNGNVTEDLINVSSGNYTITIIDASNCEKIGSYLIPYGISMDLSFDGANDYVEIPASPSLNLQDSFTIASWINPRNWGSVSGAGYGYLFTKEKIIVFLHNNGYSAYNTHSLLIMMQMENGQSIYMNTPENSVSLNSWQHVAFTYSTGDPHIYINGSEAQINYPFVDIPIGNVNNNVGDSLLLGNRSDLQRPYHGEIDEVKIWNTVLSQSEIQEQFCGINSQTNLVGYWPFDENSSSTTLHDYSTNYQNGELINFNFSDSLSGWTEKDCIAIPDNDIGVTTIHTSEITVPAIGELGQNASIGIKNFGLDFTNQQVFVSYSFSGGITYIDTILVSLPTFEEYFHQLNHPLQLGSVGSSQLTVNLSLQNDANFINDTASFTIEVLDIDRPAVVNVYGEYRLFDLDNPAIEYPFASGVSFSTGTWANNKWYAVLDSYLSDYLVTIGIFDGTVDTVAQIVDGLDGIAYNEVDSMLYGITQFGDIYLIDVESGNDSIIGNMSVSYGFRGLACSPDGLLYTVNISLNRYYTFNIQTDTSNILGYFYGEANYTGLEFDKYSGTLYSTYYDYSTASSGLIQIDTASGSFNYVGDFSTLTVTQGFAIIDITESNLSVDYYSQSVSCFGSNDGSLSAIATGGTTPYNYLWSTGDTVETISSLSSGWYFITITDDAGSVLHDSAQVTQPNEIAINATVTDVSNIGGSDGSIQLSISGGISPYTYLWSNAATSLTIYNLITGVYAVTVSDANQCQQSGVFTVNGQLNGFAPAWGYLNTGNFHTILIQNTTPVTIDGVQISNGDYLGVFYDSLGILACAGYAEWSGQPLTFIAWGNDSQTPEFDGFSSGETFKWKIWRSSDETVFEAEATYIQPPSMPNTNTYITNGMSSLSSIEAITVEYQYISLPQGWSYFSSYIDPFEPNLDSLCASFVTEVIIAKDGLGLTYWPQYGINVIGNILIGEGYQINLSSAQTMTVAGISVVPENTPITIPQGWSYLGYLRQTPAPINVLLSPIVSEVIIAKNGIGLTYWPQYGINVIGNMNPGEGYQIKMTSSQTLTYPANTSAFSKSAPIHLQPVHFAKAKNTGNNMSLGIIASNFEAEAEIGVFSPAGLLVGSAVVNSDFTAITLWGDDETTPEIDGLIEGEEFILKLWNKDVRIVELKSWIEGNISYSKDKIAIAQLSEDYNSTRILLNQNIPNPFSVETEFSFYLPEKTLVRFSIFNLLGERVDILIDKELEQGDHTLKYAINSLQSGTYYYRLETPKAIHTKKMVIMK